ncbi:hypothetical protein HUF15_23560 [Streptomyces samsunensis]|uniref:hypothetical protein n=1 Tax=Streptomyces malaysiensis TaxID=92644 RepID=UPI001581B25D|nr:hypothetical protein [Streptomyces samsunensis]NUH39706.1 hypothetical protein [Streptomyces samsunensis]
MDAADQGVQAHVPVLRTGGGQAHVSSPGDGLGDREEVGLGSDVALRVFAHLLAQR